MLIQDFNLENLISSMKVNSWASNLVNLTNVYTVASPDPDPHPRGRGQLPNPKSAILR